jgi:hypothetical protein
MGSSLLKLLSPKLNGQQYQKIFLNLEFDLQFIKENITLFAKCRICEFK